MCANGHYRIVTANPPNRNATQHAVQLAKQRLARQRCLSIFGPEAGLVSRLSYLTYLAGLTEATSLSAWSRVALIDCGMYFCIKPFTTSRPTWSCTWMNLRPVGLL